MSDSLVGRIRQRHSIAAGTTRPDIVIERVKVNPALLLLELKATRDPSYLRQGIVQLLGYVKEYEAYLDAPASAWLVAPKSNAFAAGEPSTDQVWVVDAEAVAHSVVARVAA